MQNSRAVIHPDFQPAPQFPCLPDGMEREGFLSLFESVAPDLFNLTDAEVNTFTKMARDTRPSDWKRADREPCCWREQAEIARRRGKSRLTISRHEKRLHQRKLVDKRVMADGRRSGFKGCGIFFSHAISLTPQMLSYQAEIDERDDQHKRLRNMRSVHKGHCKSAIAALIELVGHTRTVTDLIEEFEAWPDARSLRRVTIITLREHVENADETTQRALALLEKTEKMIHRGITNDAPLIQDTTQDLNTVCNASDPKRNVDKSTYSDPSAKPNGLSNCLESNDCRDLPHHKNEFHIKLGGIRMFELCSENMQMYLAARMGTRLEPNAHDIDCAVQSMLPELGINQSAWASACEVMGRDLAAMCVIIADANQTNPEIRVRNPGGYLRGMTAAHIAGNLNIMGSLIALSQRRQREQRN